MLDPARGIDEVERVIVVLFHARRDGEDVRIKDDVFRREVHFIDKDAVGALADADLLIVCRSLAVFIKSHHDRGRAIALNGTCAFLEGFFTFLQRDGIRDALALQHL